MDNHRFQDRFQMVWKIVRGRARKVSFSFGSWQYNGQVGRLWTPLDITGKIFFFTMRSNYATLAPGITHIAITKNPIINTADPLQGQLLFYIEAIDTEPLLPGNYVFDMGFKDIDSRPYALCGGNIPLLDSVTDPV